MRGIFSAGKKRGILKGITRNLTKGCDYMGKAILAAIVTLIVGYLGMVVGLELLGNWVEFGLLIAIAVMVLLSSTSMTRSKTIPIYRVTKTIHPSADNPKMVVRFFIR